MLENGFYYGKGDNSYLVYSGNMYAVISDRHWTYNGFEWAEMRIGFRRWLFNLLINFLKGD